MDTKLKSNNVTLSKKVICLVLSVLFISGSVLCAAFALSGFAVEGTLDSLSGEKSMYFNESGAFYAHVYGYLNKMRGCVYEFEDAYEAAQIRDNREAIIEEVLDNYLLEKAQIIRDELLWAYNHMDADIINENGETLREIVSTAEGLDYLKYENWVRQEAFEEDVFYQPYTALSGTVLLNFSLDYTYDEDDAKESLEEQFEEIFDNDWFGLATSFEQQLAGIQNVRCYVSYNGKTVTNMENPEKELEDMQNGDLWMYFDGNRLRQNGFSAFESSVNTKKYVLYDFESLTRFAQRLKDGVTIALYVDDELLVDEGYKSIHKGYQEMYNVNIPLLIIAAVLLFLFAVVCLYGGGCCSGYVHGRESVKLSFIDKVPTDIHLLLSWTLSLGFEALAIFLIGIYGFNCTNFRESTQYTLWRTFSYSPLVMFGVALCGAVSWLIFYEWVCSVARTVRSEKSYFGSSVFGFIVSGILKLLKIVFVKPFMLLWRAFTYQHGQFKRRFAIGWAVLFSAYLLVIEIGIVADRYALTVLFAIACNTSAAFFLLRYVEQLDEIITASAERREPDVDMAKLPKSLRILANSMSVTTHELNRAVEAAVRDERMRTELITNVSHDLKTPLTSIITYVDLLKRCDITDETALSYINVLEDKSARLKRLIEDLVEASKASSGAVKLNVVPLNFAELINQALGENSDSFRDAGIEVVFTSEQAETIIFADGQKTYRIIENLLDNACKYSAPHTRVYLRLFRQGDMGVLEIKNISRDPLNITPEELSQRFVRGDSSRTDGGNGLGLAIASDLCLLHKGELKLFIDGDLFKAQVWLPMSNRDI